MAAKDLFPNLLAPSRIGKLALRNHMVMPPMITRYSTRDGFVTQRNVDYYAARAAGGVALVIVEVACVDFPRGNARSHQIGIDDDKFLPGLSDLARAIKEHGARAMIQIHHAGREAQLAGRDLQPVAPSAIRSINPLLDVPRALTVAEIEELIGRFVDAAARAERAGFDGVEVHGAHAYLLGQFLSPLCNARDDEYGGPLANRARMILAIVRGIRARVRPDFVVGVRLTGEEPVPGGITIDETCTVATWLEEAGADVLHISGAGHTAPRSIAVAPACYPPGHLLPLAARVKQAVRVPVIGVGRLNTPEVAEAALRDGKCDLVALGRALIADPEFPHKVAAGRTAEIRPCSACVYCRVETAMDVSLVCTNNPTAGREREFALEPAAAPKKVFVIGGGVAGMEAARVAALRGHDVTLFERGDQLGGQLIAAAIPPHKAELNRLREYYLGQIAQAGVKTRLNEAPDAAAIVAAQPDAVIVATGSRAARPEMAGIAGPNVVLAEDVLLGQAAVGERVVVIGGELVGCETAEHLAAQGKRVTITRRGSQVAVGLLPAVRIELLDRLAKLQVGILTGVRYEGIDQRGVAITTADGERRLLEADTVVIAAGSTPARELAVALEGRVPALKLVGDAVQPRRFLEAIHEGMVAGLAV